MAEENQQIAHSSDGGTLAVPESVFDWGTMPPILAGHATEAMQGRVKKFYLSVVSIFEAWVNKRPSLHTRRAYRQDVHSFVDFLRLRWPEESARLLSVPVSDVREWREQLIAGGMAPKTINRRISSVSSFYKYLQAVAAETRLPIVVPNPAHAQFIGRTSQDAIAETRALTATRARQLMGLPQGDDVIAYRDRAILRFCLYTGVRIGTVCRVRVQDVHLDGV